MSEVKKAKPTIEEIATSLLYGDKLENFLDFNRFLKNNKVSKSATAPTAWAVRYKGKMIGSFRAFNDSWMLSYFKNEELFSKIDEYVTGELKEFVLANINTAPGCKNCGGAENKVILRQMFDRVCRCHLVLLWNPEGKALEYAKELVLVNKSIVDDIL